MPFWKLGVLGKIQKILKTANYNLDFFGQIQFQIIATGKPFEINGWNQFQMITLELKFSRKKVPGQKIHPVQRKGYGLFWRSKIENLPFMFLLGFRALWYVTCVAYKVVTLFLPLPPKAAFPVRCPDSMGWRWSFLFPLYFLYHREFVHKIECLFSISQLTRIKGQVICTTP